MTKAQKELIREAYAKEVDGEGWRNKHELIKHSPVCWEHRWDGMRWIRFNPKQVIKIRCR